MKRFIYAIIASAFIGSPSVGATDLSKAEKSVLRVFTDTPDGLVATGSGSVVAKGYVLTNHHVIENGQIIRVASEYTTGLTMVNVQRPQDLTFGSAAEVVWESKDLDLALLKFDLAPLTVKKIKLKPLTLRTKELQKGEKVWALGYPEISDAGSTYNLNVVPTDGIISLIKRDIWRTSTQPSSVLLRQIQHSAQINSGNSGGPLSDECGRQIGVNTVSPLDPTVRGAFLSSHILEAIPHLKSNGVNLRISNFPCIASWDVRIGILVALIIAACALLLALKRPRQKVIRAVEAMSEVIRTNKTRRQTRKAASANRKSSPTIKSALFLTGFDARGNRVKIGVPQHGADEKHGGFVIGRQADVVDAPIEDASISRRHVRLFYENHTYKIEDVNSANGTKLNGKPIAPFARIEFKVGAMITLGKIDLQTSKGDA